MRKTAIGLILTTLILLTISCRTQDATVTAVPESPSPAPTPALDVTFATLTPGPTTSSASSTKEPGTGATPTATVTAEPRVYIVQSGDTMVGIAAAHGLTLDVLMDLNPDVAPELLLVGQQLVLPSLPTSETPKADTTEQSLVVDIVGPTMYRSAMGGVWVLGEVHNASTQAAELIQVEIVLMDQAGATVARKTLWVTPATLPAGGRAPFGTLFPEVSMEGARADATLVSGRLANELGNRYFDLAVTDTEVTIGRNPVEVTGRLVNIGEHPAEHISIVTTFYDDGGVVTGFHELLLDGTLQPGETRSFSFVALPPGGAARGHEIVVQAVIAD